MLIKRPRSWEMSENLVTPEEVFLNRRAFLRGTTASIAGAATLAVAGCGEASESVAAATDLEAELTAKAAELFPYKATTSIAIDRPVTDEAVSSTYNNFYEFGSHKRIARAAEALVSRPWTIEITGEVEAGESCGTPETLATLWATGTVLPEESAPMMPTAPSAGLASWLGEGDSIICARLRGRWCAAGGSG